MSPIDYVWETVKYAGITDVDTQRAINILEDNDMRVLKGWTKEERKELEECKSGLGNSFDVVNGIINTNLKCRQLSGKYWNNNSDKEDNQMFKDIADYFNDDAKFPEQKYYVQLIKGNENSYLTIDLDGMLELDNRFEFNGWKTKFTRDEVVAIDPRFMTFMEEVEDDE